MEKEGKKGKELKRKESELVLYEFATGEEKTRLWAVPNMSHTITAAASTYNVTLILILAPTQTLNPTSLSILALPSYLMIR